MSAALSISGDVQNAMTLAQSAPVKAPRMMSNVEAAKKAASEFEGVLISQMMGAMFEGIKTDGPFGGGPGEEMFRSVMLDEYGKQVARRGGLGLADAITRSLLSHQEARSNPVETDPAAKAPAADDADATNDTQSDSDTSDSQAMDSQPVNAATTAPAKFLPLKTALPKSYLRLAS